MGSNVERNNSTQQQQQQQQSEQLTATTITTKKKKKNKQKKKNTVCNRWFLRDWHYDDRKQCFLVGVTLWIIPPIVIQHFSFQLSLPVSIILFVRCFSFLMLWKRMNFRAIEGRRDSWILRSPFPFCSLIETNWYGTINRSLFPMAIIIVQYNQRAQVVVQVMLRPK